MTNRLMAALVFMCATPGLGAQHDISRTFDESRIVEVRGIVTETQSIPSAPGGYGRLSHPVVTPLTPAGFQEEAALVATLVGQRVQQHVDPQRIAAR